MIGWKSEKGRPLPQTAPLADAHEIGTPFPLLRTFLLILLPVIIVSSIGLVFTLNNAISASAEKLFAEQEIRLVQTMLLTDGLFEGASPSAPVLSELRKEMAETGLTCLLVLDQSGGRIAELANKADCGSLDAAAFEGLTATGAATLKEDLVLPGHWTSLGVVALPRSGKIVSLAATRRSGLLESAISRLTGFWTKVFAGLLFVSVLATGVVIAKAQRTLDRQATYVRGVHLRLQRFLSVSAVRKAINDDTSATRFDAVVMFLDLRDFSSFAEGAPPSEVADLIDAFVTAVAGAVSRHDGEIDKIIGDGIMAFFEGEDADDRAVAAAVESIEACRSLARHPGVGLYRGEVIAAALGAGKRADFTILGRTVNLASRLCSLSGENEITMSEDMAARQRPDLEEVSREIVRPRHHSRNMSVVRFKLANVRGETASTVYATS